jgi:hypothetical protein
MERIGHTGNVDVEVEYGRVIARKSIGSDHFAKVQIFSWSTWSCLI